MTMGFQMVDCGVLATISGKSKGKHPTAVDDNGNWGKGNRTWEMCEYRTEQKLGWGYIVLRTP